jgi:hypothetical protein
MEPKEGTGETRTDRPLEEREPREKTVAPPMEREHETQEGALEEERQRKREKDDPGAKLP